MISLLFAIFLFFCALIYNIFRDYGIIWAGNKINHNKGAVIKGLSLLPCIILFAFNSEAKIGWALLVSWVMVCAWFWLSFDGLLNLSRQHNFWFTGSEDGKDDAKTDNLLQSVPLWLHIFIKASLVIISTYIYIKLL